MELKTDVVAEGVFLGVVAEVETLEVAQKEAQVVDKEVARVKEQAASDKVI
ncbi:hypothetical protein ES703_08343 [subsurface metagenome]